MRAPSQTYERCAPCRGMLTAGGLNAVFLAWDTLFPAQQQVPLHGLLDGTRLLAVLLWRNSDAEPWINWMHERRLIGLDQLTGDTVVLRLVPTRTVIQGLYDELV